MSGRHLGARQNMDLSAHAGGQPGPDRPLGIKLHKAEQTIRIGISFEKEDDYLGPGALVRAIHPYGLATQAGLRIDDIVLSINGKVIHSPLVAAATLRESEGDIWLSVQRPSRQPSARRSPEDGPESMRDHGPSAMRDLGMPSLHVDRAARWQQQHHGGSEESFDISQMSARALSGLTSMLTGRKEDAEASPSKAAERFMSAATTKFAKVFQSKEYEAATTITSEYRAYRARELFNEQRGAAVAMQASARRLCAMNTANMHRARYWAAVELQRWVRGFIDRAWVRVVREEVNLLHQAAEEQEGPARERYGERTNKANKVKRAFSFKRKQQRTRAPPPPAARDLLAYGGHIGANGTGLSHSPNRRKDEASDEPPTPSGGTLGSLKRSFSWGRKSKANRAERASGEKENLDEGAPYTPARAQAIKRSFSWGRSKNNA